jgi:hypothetical protein
VTQGVRTDALADPGAAGDSPHDPTSGLAVQSLTFGIREDWSVAPLADGQVDGPGDARCQRHGDQLAALPQHGDGAMAAFLTEGIAVGSDWFGHAQPVQHEQ